MRSRVGERHPALSLTPCKNKNTLFWKSCSQESFFLKSLWAIWEPDSNRCAVENFLVMQRLMLRNGMIFEQKDNHSPMAKRQDYIDTCHKSFEMGVSSKDIQKARRMAKRIRTSVACARCKAAKSKCSECRPCKRCLFQGSVCQDADQSSEDKASQHPLALAKAAKTGQSSLTQSMTDRLNLESQRFAPVSIMNSEECQSVLTAPDTRRIWPIAQQLNLTPSPFGSTQPSFMASWHQPQFVPAMRPAALLSPNWPAPAVSIPPAMGLPLLAPAALRLLLAVAAGLPAAGL